MSQPLTLTATGPLFDGTAERVIADVRDEGADRVAQALEDDVRSEVRTRASHPTGNYERSIVTTRAVSSRIVSDSGVLYGDWLEGTSGRNHRSSFKGFQMFRRARQGFEISGAVQRTIQQVFDEKKGQME